MNVFGPKWPLKRGNEDTYQVYTDLKDQINFYLRNLILTSPGENLSAPLYGVGLRRYLFEQNVPAVRERIRDQIVDQISEYLPYLQSVRVSVSSTNEEIDTGGLSITMNCLN
jgi:phage baseplate assembly protein W